MTAPDDGLPPEERAALRAYLLELGADPARIDAAEECRTLGPLAVELTVGVGGPGGQDDPLAVLTVLGDELLGPDATLSITRLIDTTTAQLANALVDAFRMQVEVPGLTAGTPYPDVVRGYAEVLQAALPQLERALGHSLRRHLVTAAEAAWSVDEERATARRDLVVGFADLVGWTSVTRASTPARLAQLVQRFEQHLADASTPHQVRIVKLLGDGAMVTCADADAACAFALDLVASVESDGQLPPVRVGLAAGQVMVLAGDHHGDVVNLAARLSAVAPAGGVLVDDEVRRRTSRTSFAPRAQAELRGFPEPVQASQVLPG